MKAEERKARTAAQRAEKEAKRHDEQWYEQLRRRLEREGVLVKRVRTRNKAEAMDRRR
jgi:N-acetylglutamate synthase-like GNAT family acetyltransferase